MTVLYLHESCSAEALQALSEELTTLGLAHSQTRSRGPVQVILEEELISPLILGQLREHPSVSALEELHPRPELVLRGENETGIRALELGDKRFDFSSPLLIAGPCVVEGISVLSEIAEQLSGMGVQFLRGGGDKIRSTTRAFRGLGLRGYRTLREVASRFGMFTVSEVVDSPNLEEASGCLDILQIGARNMHNPQFLARVGALEKPVLLKRGFGASYSEWLWAGQYLLEAGAPFLLFCERGIRTFSPMRRYTLDIHAIPFLQSMTPYPVLADPSHAAGSSPLVPPLARASLAAGANGLLVECHRCPSQSRCDARQALSMETLEELRGSFRPAEKASPTGFGPRRPDTRELESTSETRKESLRP